ncbi:putative serine/threonine-protein kinase Cx32 [Morus notabilis]|uniref:non-specific serine/threonine protein kinase n=1 Tax=Morus notabilis TaxID=981085 RepID=W9QWV5_9ROSA|nr:probable serine/threonine-protein kinase PIX13 isoform X1 [Morus notabilis]EXB56314.1 putative serine/threonine-protein kinase Cx32 [Morus notabilis]
MGNCFGVPVINHSTPATTKSFISNKSKDSLKKYGLGATKRSEKQNGGGEEEIRAVDHGKATMTAASENDNNNRETTTRSEALPLPPNSGKIITPNLKSFTLSELKKATRDFRPDTVLGEGGFGRVFKGWIDEKTYAPSRVGVGMAVAVKKSNSDSSQGLSEWQAEVKFLGKFCHPNLVKLLGYCWEENQFLLVYEYMQKGSLENHLFRKGAEPLSWSTRLKIAIGAARGLAFLHNSEKSVIYRDFKTSNILLDGNYSAKLSDFGLAKLGPVNGNSHVTTRVMGTYGYAAPEYVATGHLYVKSDVFGFGVVLLELLTGIRALDTNRPSGQYVLIDWARPSLTEKKKLKKIMDKGLGEGYPIKGAMQVAALIIKCLESEPKSRPSMEEILETLEKINAIEINTIHNKTNVKRQEAESSSSYTSHQQYHSPLHQRHIGGNTHRH